MAMCLMHTLADNQTTTTAEPDSHPSRVFSCPNFSFPSRTAHSLVSPTPMPTLLATSVPLVPPPSTPPPPPEPALTAAPFYGRSLAEYVTGFSLDLGALKYRAVLDVGAGPSSFVVEAVKRGIDAVGVDPLYGCTLSTLATHVQLDYARVLVDTTRKLEGARLTTRQALEQERRLAAQRFLSDYESGFLHNRYIGGALPRLPFLDGAFDLVLCGHVLFGPDAIFHGAERLEACRELVRVSAGEVRVGPVNGLSTIEGDELIQGLAVHGIRVERAQVPGPLGYGRQTLFVLRSS